MEKKQATFQTEEGSPVFRLMAISLLLVVGASLFLLSRYNPAPSAPRQAITLEQKMAYMQSGTPLPHQEARLVIPRWMLVLILVFVIIQTLPLLMAAYKAKGTELTRREVRQIEFLTEMPLFFGLLGSLLGVCMTQFLNGSLSAPLAYLTTISGILLFLFGRFAILVSLPSSNDMS